MSRLLEGDFLRKKFKRFLELGVYFCALNLTVIKGINFLELRGNFYSKIVTVIKGIIFLKLGS